MDREPPGCGQQHQVREFLASDSLVGRDRHRLETLLD